MRLELTHSLGLFKGRERGLRREEVERRRGKEWRERRSEGFEGFVDQIIASSG